jgi:putative tricarboxylic transport membrane protein
MITFHDDWTVFFGSPISATLMVLALISLAFPKIRELIAKKRKNVSQAAPVEASATTQQLN